MLRLRGNDIGDLTPLVANPGLGAGDAVYLGGNPIDCAAQAANIEALRSRGVQLDLDCP